MQNQEKPARIRIESKMQHALDVPLPGPGKSIRGTVRIPKATKDGPGVLETDEIDAKTLSRLRYHYEWRPSDHKLFGKRRDEIPADQIVEIGLMRITILPPEAAPAPKDGKAQKAA
jgi:hypothetical protein